MDALILAGGLGTRLRSVVKDRAKSVAQVAGEPFLAFVLRHLATLAQLRRVILCVGHQAGSIEEVVGTRFGRLDVVYSREEKPLGTGGALRRALVAQHVAPPALALNGDTYFPVRLERLLAFHREETAAATLALACVENSARYGAVRVAGGRVVGFEEKGPARRGWINGGLYVLGPPAIAAIEQGPESFSMEHDVLPALMRHGGLAAFRSRARFIDIGIPADYRRARALLARSAEDE
jgi:NDP-sugar pyrophosphorylase family protein